MMAQVRLRAGDVAAGRDDEDERRSDVRDGHVGDAGLRTRVDAVDVDMDDGCSARSSPLASIAFRACTAARVFAASGPSVSRQMVTAFRTFSRARA